MMILRRVSKLTMLRFPVLMMVILFLCVGGFAQAKECSNYDKNIKYKIILRDISAARSEVFLNIYLEPEKFTIDHMLKLSARLKAEYCNLSRISARFYDVKKIVEFSDPLPNPLPVGEIKTLMRGFYNLDRNKKEEELNFRPAKPDTEISVIFKLNGYCISQTDIEEEKPSEPN